MLYLLKNWIVYRANKRLDRQQFGKGTFLNCVDNAMQAKCARSSGCLRTTEVKL